MKCTPNVLILVQTAEKLLWFTCISVTDVKVLNEKAERTFIPHGKVT